MNLLDAVVTDVVSEPEKECGKWWLVVKYRCYGVPGQTSIWFDTKEEASSIIPGYEFQV